MFETLDTLLKVLILNGFTPLSIALIIASIFLSGVVFGVLINRHFGTKPFWTEKEFTCVLEDKNGTKFKVDVSVLFKNAKIARIDCPFFKKGKCKGDHKCLMLEKRL